jgi:carbon monoxide dehydrogenase subunit G
MVALSLIAIARAAEPSIAVEDDGTVVGRVEVAATESEVRALLTDPVTAGSLTPGVLSVSPTPQGACTLLDVETRGPWDPLTYRGLRCPTADGWEQHLVASEDFARVDVHWKLAPTDTGTAVEYRVNTAITAPVPARLVRRGVEQSARETLVALVERLIR